MGYVLLVVATVVFIDYMLSKKRQVIDNKKG